jgi:Rod binding domain-containing protein
MNPVTALSGALPGSAISSSDSPERIVKAARDFEAVLLRSLLEPLQKSFSTIAGESSQAGQGDYEYMGTEALAIALAASGGLGIADMITKQLERASSAGEKIVGCRDGACPV